MLNQTRVCMKIVYTGWLFAAVCRNPLSCAHRCSNSTSLFGVGVPNSSRTQSHHVWVLQTSSWVLQPLIWKKSGYFCWIGWPLYYDYWFCCSRHSYNKYCFGHQPALSSPYLPSFLQNHSLKVRNDRTSKFHCKLIENCINSPYSDHIIPCQCLTFYQKWKIYGNESPTMSAAEVKNALLPYEKFLC